VEPIEDLIEETNFAENEIGLVADGCKGLSMIELRSLSAVKLRKQLTCVTA